MWNRRNTNGNYRYHYREFGIRMDSDPCMPKYNANLVATLGTSRTEVMFFQANLANYNSECSTKLMAISNLPS